MNMHRLSTRLLIGVCLAQVFSCQKQLDKTEGSIQFDTSSDAALVSEFADCKLRTVTHTIDVMADYPKWEVKGTFVYHADGRPDQLTYTESFGYAANYYFTYDGQKRLKELMVGPSRTQGGDASEWHKYGYNNANQIIVDTLFNFQGTELSTATPRIVSTLTYDAQGRVNTELETWYSGGHVDFTRNFTYNYDAKGNLLVGGWASSSYDNNISIYRTHPLFQFIHRNYSKNNATAQPKYNVKGLPLSNSPSNDDFFSAYATTRGGTGVVKATYDCDGFVPANEFLYCKMRTVTHLFDMPPGTADLEVKGTFVYHPDGRPDNLTYTNGGISGTPNFYFTYDSQQRLKQLLISHKKTEGGDMSLLHKYGYNSFNQIIVDSVFGFTSFELSSAVLSGVSTLAYDAQGRVKTETTAGGSIITYNYDSRGNLIVNGWPSSSYDNKVSMYRAHSIFQFIHRNYSRNNASAQARYNSKGLPLSNKLMNDNFFGAYPSTVKGTDIVKINYDCP